MKKFFIGLLVSCIFIWFSIKGVEYEEIIYELKEAKYIYLIPTVILFLGLTFLRSIRWGVILSPIEKISQKRLLPISCVGYMAIVLIPMRIGEFVRPYLVSRKNNISMSSGLATIFVERVLDSLTLLFMLLVVIISSQLPEWVVRTGYSFLLTFIFIVSFMFFLYYKTELTIRLLRPLLSIFPQKVIKKIESLIRTFVEGFQIISNPTELIVTIFLSILVWTLSALAIYCLFHFQNFQLPLMSTFVVLVITIIGVSLPAAPGFLGNFQFGCIMALSIFGIHKSDAFTFSMIYYFFGIGINILLGLVCLPLIDNFYDDFMKTIKR